MMEYLQNVAEVRELDNKVAEWQRKVSIVSPPAVFRRASASAKCSDRVVQQDCL